MLLSRDAEPIWLVQDHQHILNWCLCLGSLVFIHFERMAQEKTVAFWCLLSLHQN